MSADIIKINGKVYTRSRAVALGLIEGEGPGAVNPKATPAAAKVSRPRAPRGPRAPKAGFIPAPDGGKVESGDKPAGKPKVIKPLVPGNVDAEGNKVQDPDALAKIEAETAAIEAARKAEREANGTDLVETETEAHRLAVAALKAQGGPEVLPTDEA